MKMSKMENRLLSAVRKMIVEEITNLEGKSRLSESSVDDQIDAQFSLFEKRSIPSEASDVAETRRYSLLTLLEADEPDPAEEEPVEEAPADAEPEAEPVETLKPELEVDAFAARVARLVENHENLLDIPTVIINRAVMFITENYDETMANTFVETLEKDHGISIQPKDNRPPTPAAVGAGPG